MNRTLRLLFVCLLQAVWAVASAYNLKVEATPHGACSLNTSGGDYDEGSSVYLRAYGNAGYVFKGWYKGDEVISSSASFYYTMPAEDVVLQARYYYDPSVPSDPAMPDTTKRYKLTLGITPNGAGSLNTSGGTYTEGTNLSLRAYVNTGYHFTGWTDEEGNTLSTSTSYSYTMPGRNVHLTANYYYDPSVPANPDSMTTNYTVLVKCKPVGGGSFNTSSTTAQEGSSVRLYSYTNTGYIFKHWEDSEGKVLSTAQNFYYTIPHGNSVVYGVFEYDPPVPSNPGKNYWNKELGEVIVDDFSAGYLGNAVSSVIGGSSRDEVAMITVAGKMNDNDFGIANNYTNCTLLDLSRVTGITTVPSYAFDYTNLESIYLPASIETIGYKAFYECKQLSSLTVYAMVPPAVEDYAFSGIPEGLVVYVPAASISQYQEAEGWKNFTFLPIQEDIRNVTITLPEGTDASVYAQMWLELTNKKSGQRMHFVMTDRSSYTFANIIRNTSWNAVVRNQRGDVFGKIDGIDVADEDVTVAIESLQVPQNVTLTVKDGEGQDVTADTQITWTDAAGNYLSQSYSVNGLLPGNKLGYNIVLSQNLAMAYAAPSLTEYTVAESDNNIVCTLSPLQKVVVSGKVIDLTTKYAISGAVVSASQTFGGKYSKTTNVKTDAKGQYSIEVFRVPTSLAIAASDYISQTIECDVIDADGENVSVADVSLKSITGAVISLGFTYTKCPDNEGEEGVVESFYSDYNNVDYAIFNKTQNRRISQFNVQYPNIVLLEEVSENDVLELTASSRTSAFVPVKATATIDAEQRASATFDIVGLGKLKSSFAVNGNASVVGSLYDAKGKLIKTYDYSGGKLIVSDLADGNYTLVTMGSSRLFNTIYDLSQLPQTGLTKDVDYVQNNVKVESGKLSVISIAEVPTLDESKLYYTGDNTSFTVNKSSIVAGNYLTLTGHLDFKSAYSTKVSNVNLIVDLPESCSFVENSVMVGNSTSSYTLEGNRVIIPMARYTDRVRFCIIPTLGGDYAPSALAQFDIEGETITQPIGSVSYTAKDLSISVPSTVAKTTIPVSGTAIGASDIEIYDGDVLIGQTRSLANGTWATTCELINPYNLSTHNIFAKVTTKAGIGLLSETVNCLYDKNAIEVNTVTMINTAHTSANLDLYDYVTVFDFQNPKESYPAYWYWPSYPDFTFLVDFTNNDTTIVKDVVLYVFTDHNEVITLYPEYDAKKDVFVATAKFDSYSLPYNVSVDFTAKIQQTIDGKQLSDSKQNVLSLTDDFWKSKQIIDIFYNEHDNATSEDYFNLCKQLGLPIDSEELLPIDTSLPEGVTEDNIDDFLEKAEKDFEERFAIISEEVKKFSGMFQLSDNYELELESGYKFTLGKADGISEDYLQENGYSQFQLSEGGSIFIRTTEEYSTFVNLKENTIITIKNPANESHILSKSSRAKLTDDFAEVFDKIETAKLLVKTINEDFQRRIMMPVKAQEKYIKDLERDIKEIKRYITCMCKEGSDAHKFWLKRLKDAEYTLSVAKTALKLSGPLLRFLARSIPVLDYLATLADCYSIAQELQGIYLSIPDPCPEDQTNANWCKAQDITILIATGVFAIADVIAEISADAEILGGAAAAVTTGGASLAVSGWGIVQKALAELGKYALTTATKHFAIKELRKRVRELKCKSPNPNPNIPSPPGGGAPNVKDPSGYVYEGVSSNRLEGVTATAYYKEVVEDMYGDKHENIVKWDATEYAQENPLFTDEYGMYAWDVPNGLWQVKFEKEGYETTYSEWLPVPPPQLDINIAMKQNVQPTVKSARAFEDAVEMEFDKYMMPELLTTDNIRVMAGETAVEGTVELLNEEVSYEGNEEKFASKVRFNAAAPFDATEITLMVSNRVKSYAGIRMQDDFSQTFTIEPEVREIVCESNASVVYGNSGELTVQVLPAVASAGKTVKVKSSSTMILSTDVEELTLDSEGKASLTVNGELPGAAAITYSVDGYDLSATTMVSVEQEQLIPDSPVASVASGSALLKGSSVTLSCPTSGVTIYYTTDGSCPCDAGAIKYEGTPITVSKGMTLKAMAVGEKGDESNIATYIYTIRQTDLQIPLEKGWNWISHNRYADLTSEELQQDYVERVLTQTCEIYRDPKIGFTGNINDVSANDGIKVNMSAQSSLKLDGDMFNPYLEPVSLKAGWNWIGYPLSVGLTVDNALVGMNSEVGDFVVNINDGFSQYDGEKWIGTLNVMAPGKGYLMKSASDKEFIYNTLSVHSSKALMAKAGEQIELPWSVDVRKYPNVMCVTAELYANELKSDDGKYVVAAFVDGECRGIGKTIGDKVFLMVHGGDKADVDFFAFDTESGSVYDIEEKAEFTADIIGSVALPQIFHLGGISGINSVIYDKPASKSIHNILGQKVKSIDRSGVYIIDGKKVVVTKKNENDYSK